jgi:hypothetical protein
VPGSAIVRGRWPIAPQSRRPWRFGQTRAQTGPQLLAQGVEVVGFGDDLAALVLHAKAHAQVRGQAVDVPRVGRDAHAAQRLELAPQCGQQRLAVGPEARHDLRRELVPAPEVAAQRLGQRADELGDQLVAQ